VLFTAMRNFEQDIFVYNLADKKTLNLTNTGVSEASPAWSPDGKYIYFSSNRIKPAYPTGMENASLYRMALENYDEPYRISKFDDRCKESDKETVEKDRTRTKDGKNCMDKKAKPAGKDEKRGDKYVLVSIHVQGRPDRSTRVTPQG